MKISQLPPIGLYRLVGISLTIVSSVSRLVLISRPAVGSSVWYYGVVGWLSKLSAPRSMIVSWILLQCAHHASTSGSKEGSRPDRRLLRWYAMRRVVLLVGPVLLCTSRMRPVVEIGSYEPGLGR